MRAGLRQYCFREHPRRVAGLSLYIALRVQMAAEHATTWPGSVADHPLPRPAALEAGYSVLSLHVTFDPFHSSAFLLTPLQVPALFAWLHHSVSEVTLSAFELKHPTGSICCGFVRGLRS